MLVVLERVPLVNRVLAPEVKEPVEVDVDELPWTVDEVETLELVCPLVEEDKLVEEVEIVPDMEIDELTEPVAELEPLVEVREDVELDDPPGSEVEVRDDVVD